MQQHRALSDDFSTQKLSRIIVKSREAYRLQTNVHYFGFCVIVLKTKLFQLNKKTYKLYITDRQNKILNNSMISNRAFVLCSLSALPQTLNFAVISVVSAIEAVCLKLTARLRSQHCTVHCNCCRWVREFHGLRLSAFN